MRRTTADHAAIDPAMLPVRLPRARRSLLLRVVLAVVMLITISTAVCGVVTAQLAARVLDQTRHRDAAVLINTAARLVEPMLNRADRHGEVVRIADQVTFDPRVAFLIITDVRQVAVVQRHNDPVGWQLYQAMLSPRDRLAPIGVNQPIKLADSDGHTVFVRKAALYDRDPAGLGTRLIGYVTLGLHDPDRSMLAQRLNLGTLAAVGIICLVGVPAVLLWARTWVRPLRRMIAETLRLGLGQQVHPVPEDRDDEIGLLARAFNAMAANLCAIQQALVRANEQLEHKVRHRTAELEKANRRLEQEARDKDQFIRAVSHDLNAPIRNIVGMTGLLIRKYESQLADDVLTKLQRIAANARTEAELLADLLEISRLKTQPGKEQPVDLNELLADVAGSLSYDLEQRSIRLNVAGPLPVVRADRNRMRQVFQNLLDNAVKYMPADQPVKRIEVGFTDRDGEPVFYVRDTGRGIAEQDVAHVFDLFRRARYSGDQHHIEGRGVGLASVKTIIESLGGQIEVDTQLGEGATFIFTLDPARYIDPPASRAA